jgi:hypothetical protein
VFEKKSRSGGNGCDGSEMSARTCSAMNVTVQPPTYSAATISRLKHEPSAHLRGMSHTKCPHKSKTRHTPPPPPLPAATCLLLSKHKCGCC